MRINVKSSDNMPQSVKVLIKKDPKFVNWVRGGAR